MGRWSFSARTLNENFINSHSSWLVANNVSQASPRSPGASLVRAADHGLLPPGYVLLDPPETQIRWLISDGDLTMLLRFYVTMALCPYVMPGYIAGRITHSISECCLPTPWLADWP